MDQQYKLPKKIPLEDGEVIFIRLIRSDLKLKILGETFMVKEKLMYSYVECIIVIESDKLVIRRDGIVEHIFHFFIPYY